MFPDDTQNFNDEITARFDELIETLRERRFSLMNRMLINELMRTRADYVRTERARLYEQECVNRIINLDDVKAFINGGVKLKKDE